jgi:hypothetical protein
MSATCRVASAVSLLYASAKVAHIKPSFLKGATSITPEGPAQNEATPRARTGNDGQSGCRRHWFLSRHTPADSKAGLNGHGGLALLLANCATEGADPDPVMTASP